MNILYEDAYLLVIDKPPGLVVHSDGANNDNNVSMVNLLKGKIFDPHSARPGIVHRLDKDTSGVMVVAKTIEAKRFLQAQFKQRQVDKYYLAAVKGHLTNHRARLELPIGRHPKNPLKRSVKPSGKPAVSEYEVLEEKSDASMLKVRLQTGRTHQIRVQLKHIGHPVLGDKLYGSVRPGLLRLFLHSSELSFIHPDGAKREFKTELPADLAGFWYNLS